MVLRSMESFTQGRVLSFVGGISQIYWGGATTKHDLSSLIRCLSLKLYDDPSTGDSTCSF